MAMITSILISFLAIFSLSSGNDEFKIVQTENGDIRGKLLTTIYEAKPYYSFRGIPYAKPPLKELRYKVPESPAKWTNVLNAFEYGNECAQKSILFANNKIYGSEDCLYLNVFTPVIKSNEKLPVMVWIHGGAYLEGSANSYRPDFLVNNDVILVTLNYRLGPFGFLSLGTADYSGNNGLKDQLFALKWVQRNIEQFGGDKNLVTIFGESAGSTSTHFHVLSEKSQGLFKRAIMQSGSVLNPWALYRKSDHLEAVYKLARRFGHNPQNTEDLLNFLKRVDPLIFTEQSAIVYNEHGAARKEVELVWGPIVEVSHAKEPFLTKTPHEYVYDKKTKQNIDTLHGFCSAETVFITLPELMHPSILKEFSDEFEFQFPRTDVRNEYKSKDYQKMAKEIRDFYFAKTNGQINEDSIVEYNDMLSDSWFMYGIDQSVKAQVDRTTGNVYYYQFSVDTKLNIVKTGMGRLPPNVDPIKFPGTSHIEDMFYMFYYDFPGTNLNEIYDNITEDSTERKSIKLVSKLWTDFAKFGNPTPNGVPIDLKPVRNNEINYVDITNDGLVAGIQPLAERIEFWDQFYKKYEHKLRKLMIKDEL